MSPALRTLLVLGSVLGTAAAEGQGSASPRDRAEPPVFQAETGLVALPVFVTDRKGQAVAGLTAADFEVEDGGKAARVAAFEAVDAASHSGGETPGSALAAYTRRQILLLFDLSFSDPAGLLRSRAGALQILERGFGPRDLASVAVLGRGGLLVLVGFTRDTTALKSAVENLRPSVGERLEDPAALARQLNLFVLRDGATSTFDVDAYRDAELRSYSRRVEDHLYGLEALTRMLRGVPGRKQVVLFSGGFDQGVLAGLLGDSGGATVASVFSGGLSVGAMSAQGDLAFGSDRAQAAFTRLGQGLARADAVLHTVDSGGLEASVDMASEVPVHPGRRNGSLGSLAAISGGVFLKETSEVSRALDTLLESSRHFYVLGMVPVETARPGSFRSLKVKVRRPGLSVSHRKGYVVGDRDAAPSVGLDAIARGVSGGAFGVKGLAESFRDGTGARMLPVVLEVDGPALLAGVDEESLSLEVYGYLLDSEGRFLDAFTVRPMLDTAKLRERILESGLQVLTVFKAPEGTADLRFLVRHPASGRAAALRMSVATADAPWSLSSPLVMSDPTGRVAIPVGSRAEPDLDLPFRVGQLPFSPEVDPTLRNGLAREVCVMARPPRGPSLEVRADLRAADGTRTSLESSGPVRLAKDRDGAFRIVLSLTPRDIPRGDYALRVTLRDETGEEVFAERPVGIR